MEKDLFSAVIWTASYLPIHSHNRRNELLYTQLTPRERLDPTDTWIIQSAAVMLTTATLLPRFSTFCYLTYWRTVRSFVHKLICLTKDIDLLKKI